MQHHFLSWFAERHAADDPPPGYVSDAVAANIAASVRARPANKARVSQRPFQGVLRCYGLERFLYRFSRTEHCDRFLFKGALMFRVWEAPRYFYGGL